MPKYIFEGFVAGFGGFDEGGIVLDVDKVNLVLTTASATSFSYEYDTIQMIDIDIAGDYTFALDGQVLGDRDVKFGFANVTWGAGLSTQLFGGELASEMGLYVPVRGDRMPNLDGDKGHVAIEFFQMTDLTGKFTKVKKGPFAEGQDIDLRDFALDNTTGAFKQGKNASERLVGGKKDDLIVAQKGDDDVVGKGGRDTLLLGRGDDKGNGGSGNDVISGYIGDDRLIGGKGNDKLYGDLFDDKLYGGSGQDKLFGGNDADRLDGGKGNDQMRGEGGRDKFVFKIKSGDDLIRDFGDGKDRLLLDDKLFGNISEEQVVNRYADVVGNKIVMDFGSGDKLTLNNYTKINALADFIDII